MREIQTEICHKVRFPIVRIINDKISRETYHNLNRKIYFILLAHIREQVVIPVEFYNMEPYKNNL